VHLDGPKRFVADRRRVLVVRFLVRMSVGVGVSVRVRVVVAVVVSATMFVLMLMTVIVLVGMFVVMGAHTHRILSG